MKKILIFTLAFCAYCYIDWYSKPTRERVGVYGPEESYRPPEDIPDTTLKPIDTIAAYPTVEIKQRAKVKK